jgi:hypothetical protein
MAAARFQFRFGDCPLFQSDPATKTLNLAEKTFTEDGGIAAPLGAKIANCGSSSLAAIVSWPL